MPFSKILFFVSFFTLAYQGYSQSSWKQVWKIPMDSNAVWDIDNLRYCYVYSNQSFKKIDQQGKIILQESYKSFGEITKIDAKNPLKIACFSEGQQRICFLDNALAQQNDCVELNDLGIELSAAFSASLQTDRVWIYDEPNSKLLLVTLRTGQSQQSQNIKGLLELATIEDMQEIDNRLYVFDANNQVVWFDQFGNFMDYVQLPASKLVYPFNQLLLIEEENQIVVYDLNGVKQEIFWSNDIENTESPVKIRINSDLLFVQTQHSLICYRFVGQ